MLDHAREAAALTRDRTRADLDRDRMLQLSLAHLIEIIGEAASRVPRDIQARHVAIPWIDIVGMRHRIVHGYDTLDLNVLWDTATRNLPPLIAALEAALAAPD